MKERSRKQEKTKKSGDGCGDPKEPCITRAEGSC